MIQITTAENIPLAHLSGYRMNDFFLNEGKGISTILFFIQPSHLHIHYHTYSSPNLHTHTTTVINQTHSHIAGAIHTTQT